MEQSLIDRLVSGANVSSDTLARLTKRLAGVTHVDAGFWQRLRCDPAFSDRDVDELRFSAGLVSLADDDPQLLADLQQRRARGELDRPNDLFRLDWASMVSKQAAAPTPVGQSDAQSGTGAASDPNVLRARLETIFPSEAVVFRTSEEDVTPQRALSRFFQANPSFDVAGARVDEYLEAHASALDGVTAEERPDVIDRLKALQRLWTLTEGLPQQYATIRALLAAKYDSAQSISATEKSAFRAGFEATPAIAANAATVHDRACHRASTDIAMYARHSPKFDAVALAAISSTKAGDLGPLIPDWKKLFGSLDHFQPRQSILSPSAYLSDLLHVLGRLQLTFPLGGSIRDLSALEVLAARRPDIACLELSAANAETLIPHLDLVNEILERAVFPWRFDIREGVPGLIDDLNGGNLSAAVLAAFRKAGRSVDPKDVPSVRGDKDAWWEFLAGGDLWRISAVAGEAGEYLSVAIEPAITPQTEDAADDLRAQPRWTNVAAYEVLRDATFPWSMPFDLWAREANAFLDYAKVPRQRLMALFSEASEEQLAAEFFGLSANDLALLNCADHAGCALWGFTNGETDWIARLAEVPTFLARTELTYDDLVELTATRYVNPKRPAGPVFSVERASLDEQQRIAQSAADPALAKIAGLDVAVLDRVHRFVRFQRKTPWSIRELDAVLDAVGCDPASNKIDGSVIAGARLIAEVQKRFGIPLDEILGWFAELDPRQRAGEAPSLYDRLFRSPAMRRDEDKAFEVDPRSGKLRAAIPLNTRNRAIISGALRVNSPDLERLLAEVLEKPATGEETLDLPALSVLYCCASMSRALKVPVEDYLALCRLCGAGALHRSGGSRRDRAAAVRTMLDAAERVATCGFSIEALSYLLADERRSASAIALSDTVIGKLLEGLREAVQPVRQDYKRARVEIVHQLAAAMGLGGDITGRLAFPSPNDDATDPGSVLMAFLSGTGEPSSVESANAFAVIRRLHRAALLVSRLGLAIEELGWIDATTGTVFDARALPLRPHAQAEGLDDFFSLVELVEIRRQRGGAVVAALLALQASKAAPEREAAQELVARSSGWPIDAIAALDVRLEEARGHEVNWVARFVRCLEATTTLGITVAQASSWAALTLTAPIAHEIELAVKSRHDRESWLKLAVPLRDALREKQRTALISYLLPRLGFASANDLYQHYLVDVEMGARAMTSRTKLAIGSVQLFVQRLLMNLERARLPSGGVASLARQAHVEAFKKEWNWVKAYRLWEANRKVFLYPENWIEPELRKDKTAQFRDLENELMQDEITAASAERAFRGYVERIDELARLEIYAIGFDQLEIGAERASPEVLHVFGRTRSVPQVPHYRRREHGVWTPWERLDAGIEGDHLIPVVLDHRLFLFWPEFHPEVSSELRLSDGTPLKTVKREALQVWEYWSIRLAFSECRQGIWTPKKLLDASLRVDLPAGGTVDGGLIRLPDKTKPAPLGEDKVTDEKPKRTRSDLSNFTFVASTNDTSVTIACERCDASGSGTYTTLAQGGFRLILLKNQARDRSHRAAEPRELGASCGA